MFALPVRGNVICEEELLLAVGRGLQAGLGLAHGLRMRGCWKGMKLGSVEFNVVCLDSCCFVFCFPMTPYMTDQGLVGFVSIIRSCLAKMQVRMRPGSTHLSENCRI